MARGSPSGLGQPIGVWLGGVGWGRVQAAQGPDSPLGVPRGPRGVKFEGFRRRHPRHMFWIPMGSQKCMYIDVF